jgi:ribosomal protein S18 acetylase RimI-like enzyme
VTRLLAALARKAIPRATILTHDTNPGAVALYERLGFRVDFRYPQFYLRW